jgi:hypothetical protein
MERVGLIPSFNRTSSTNSTYWATFADSKEEDVAWYEYQTATVAGAIGRSMYAIQIRQWLQALRMAGQNPAEQVLIVRTDHVAIDPAAAYARVLRFLHLPDQSLHKMRESPSVAVTHQTRPISPETRKRLETFYRPYNRRLKRLIRQYGISSTAEDDNF